MVMTIIHRNTSLTIKIEIIQKNIPWPSHSFLEGILYLCTKLFNKNMVEIIIQIIS